MLKGFKRIAPPKDAPVTLAPTVVLSPTLPVVLSDAVISDEPEAGVSPVPNAASGPHYPELSEKFLLAGRALFTVSNPKGDHYTFKVRRVESEWPAGSGKMSNTYFVNVKTSGTDRPYQYVGILKTDTGDIKCTAKSVFLPGTKEYDIAAWACKSVIGMKLIPEGYHIEHAGHCGKCGRTLTDPESIQRGIGPECWSVMSGV